MSQVGPGYIRIVAGGEEVARYSFTGAEFSTERAVMLADVYLKDVWRFAAVGQGFDGGLDALLRNFGGEVAEEAPAAAPPQQAGAPGFAPPPGGAAPAPSFGAPAGPPQPAPAFGAPPGAPQPAPAFGAPAAGQGFTPPPGNPSIHQQQTMIAPLATPPQAPGQPQFGQVPPPGPPPDRCPASSSASPRPAAVRAAAVRPAAGPAAVRPGTGPAGTVRPAAGGPAGRRDLRRHAEVP